MIFYMYYCIYFYAHQQKQHQRGAANGISMTLQSLFKAIAPACAGAL